MTLLGHSPAYSATVGCVRECIRIVGPAAGVDERQRGRTLKVDPIRGILDCEAFRTGIINQRRHPFPVRPDANRVTAAQNRISLIFCEKGRQDRRRLPIPTSSRSVSVLGSDP